MDLEYHYYHLYFLAKRAGFSAADAQIIAYSSQYVDASLVSYPILTPDQKVFNTTITQNYGWWDESFFTEVYLPFHFCPGDITHSGARRLDGLINHANTTPNSPQVKAVFLEALRSKNLYRIGIAAHIFADSFAHQNFSGYREDFNKTDKDSPIPPIGHAQVLQSPDKLAKIWKDSRLEQGLVINALRFFQASQLLYKYFCVYNAKDFEDADMVLGELARVLGFTRTGHPGMTAADGTPSYQVAGTQTVLFAKHTQERVLDLIIEKGVPQYDKDLWLKEAVFFQPEPHDDVLYSGYSAKLWLVDAIFYKSKLFEQEKLKARDSFYSSSLFRWNEAALEHRRVAQGILHLS